MNSQIVPNKNVLETPVIIITGASSGIGAAAARLLGGEHDLRVVLAARRVERLRALEEQIQAAGGQALSVPTDVTRLDQLHNLVEATQEHYGRIDVLFNNAGFGRLKELGQLEPVDDIQAQVRVNLSGLIHTTRLILPIMQEQGRGHIINMSSVAGFVAPPSYSVYSATKYAVRGFTESLRREVAGSDIQVSGIYPGTVETEFSHHTGSNGYAGYRTPGFLTLSPEAVAESVWRVIQRPRPTVVIPPVMKSVIWINQFFPRLVDWVIRQAISLRSS